MAVDEHRDMRAMNRGLGTGMTRAMEIILTPAIFAGFGWLLDRWFGLSPILTVAFGLFGVVGVFAKLWLGYDAEMTRHEDDRKAAAERKQAAA